MELRGLIVREPFATMIVTGIKKWEIRKRNTRIRGPILIISNSVIKGVVDLYDVTGPYSADELNKFFAFHRVPSNFLKRYCKGQRVFVWKLRNPVKFAEEIKIKIPRGAQVWVKIPANIVNHINGIVKQFIGKPL